MIICERCTDKWPDDTQVEDLVAHARDAHKMSRFMDEMFQREPKNRLGLALKCAKLAPIHPGRSFYQPDVPPDFGYFPTRDPERVRDLWTVYPFADVIMHTRPLTRRPPS